MKHKHSPLLVTPPPPAVSQPVTPCTSNPGGEAGKRDAAAHYITCMWPAVQQRGHALWLSTYPAELGRVPDGELVFVNCRPSRLIVRSPSVNLPWLVLEVRTHTDTDTHAQLG